MWRAASGVVEPALKAHPADPVLQNLAGVIAAQRGAFESAEAHFQTAIRLAPKGPAAYQNLGRLYQERADGNPAMRAKAIAIYRRLLDADPASVEAMFQSGFLLALDGQFAASRAMLERLPEDVRQRPQALAVLAADLGGLGDTAAARRVVDALAAHPALTEADVLAALPALPAGPGDARGRAHARRAGSSRARFASCPSGPRGDSHPRRAVRRGTARSSSARPLPRARRRRC